MILWFLTACPDPGPAREAALAAAHEEVAAGYRQLATGAAALAADAEALCADPDPAALETARDRWRDARSGWMHSTVAAFGPVVEQPDRLGPPIDFGPVDPEAVEERIASDLDLSPSSFAAFGAGVRGLPAVEYVLFEPNAEAALADPRRCAFLVGATADLSTNADRLVDAWQEWRPMLTDPSGEPYAVRQDVIDEWVNRVAFTAEDIRRDGLPDDPALLPSRFARRSAADTADALDGAHAVLVPLLAVAEDPDLEARVTDAHTLAHDRLAELPEPLVDTLLVQPELVTRAEDAVRAYQVIVATEVAQALSVTVTFNDNDGD